MACAKYTAISALRNQFLVHGTFSAPKRALLHNVRAGNGASVRNTGVQQAALNSITLERFRKDSNFVRQLTVEQAV